MSDKPDASNPPASSSLTRLGMEGWRRFERSWAVLRWLVVSATAWYLLKELAPLLRPLLLAVFMAYIILPMRMYVSGQARSGIGHLAVLVGFCAIVVLLGMWAYGDIVELAREIPRLRHELTQAVTWAADYAGSRIPALSDLLGKTTAVEEQGATRLQDALGSALNATAGMLGEGIQVIFFLILILFEAGRLPRRLQVAFPDEQAEHVQARIANINAAIASYLRVKVKANLFLAIPAMLVLWLFGIKLVVLWGLLTFFANFVPYLGSVVACALPISFGLLDRGFVWQPMVGAIVLVGVHLTSAYLVEPAMTGKAVDLSPLVVLIALSFWGLCWGLVGMVLAVPLAAVLKIIFENSPSTRPIAKLMGGE